MTHEAAAYLKLGRNFASHEVQRMTRGSMCAEGSPGAACPTACIKLAPAKLGGRRTYENQIQALTH